MKLTLHVNGRPHELDLDARTTLLDCLRETLGLRAIEGMSQAETAEALGISEKAVETRLYRARLRLAAEIDRQR